MDLDFFQNYKDILLSVYKYYSNSLNDASSSVFMTIGGFTKFLREASLITIDNNEKIVNYKLEFPFNLTLTTKAKFSGSLKSGVGYNTMNNFHSFKKVIKIKGYEKYKDILLRKSLFFNNRQKK